MTVPLPWSLSKDDPAGADLEDRLQENFDKLAQQFPVGIQQVSQVPQARVYNSAAITCTTGVVKTLTFDTERYDTNSIHSTTVNTSRLTCVTAGLYSIGGNAEFANNAVGTRNLAVLLNGVTTIVSEARGANGADLTRVNVHGDYRLVAGDYVELIAFQTSGGNLNVTAAGNYSPEFWMHWVSP
jgi:hypothetical protein